MSEDRQDYERILDEALRSAPHRPDLTAVGQRLNPEQLRTMALNATALITAAAATEYHHYVKVREELRRPGPAAVEEAAASAGAVAVLAVLTPVLTGTAAAIFLLVGYVLRMVDPHRTHARTLLTTGWVFGAVTAVAILVAAIGLLLTALRHGSSAHEESSRGESTAEVARAREAWREALLERGILPFLRDALADPGEAALSRRTPEPTHSRIPHLGYDHPGSTGPDSGPATGPHPGYSDPEFTGPDLGEPEHEPD
ncbi:hypothetical protein [Streptomyces sp. NPDC007264]|uniref:hypothetical protein n=1 Tax=Streptomyces sp. NPDC007264 TaxID=3364777 RepID=UPI0036DE270E